MEKVMYSVMGKKYPEADWAEGMYIYDKTGKKYLDCAAGIAVVNVGHGVQEIVERMAEQAKKISFVYGEPLPAKQERVWLRKL